MCVPCKHIPKKRTAVTRGYKRHKEHILLHRAYPEGTDFHPTWVKMSDSMGINFQGGKDLYLQTLWSKVSIRDPSVSLPASLALRGKVGKASVSNPTLLIQHPLCHHLQQLQSPCTSLTSSHPRACGSAIATQTTKGQFCLAFLANWSSAHRDHTRNCKLFSLSSSTKIKWAWESHSEVKD